MRGSKSGKAAGFPLSVILTWAFLLGSSIAFSRRVFPQMTGKPAGRTERTKHKRQLSAAPFFGPPLSGGGEAARHQTTACGIIARS